MKLDEFLPYPAATLKQSGPHDRIMLSSRVRLARNLLIGEDAYRGSDESLLGNVDDVLVYGKALSESDIATLSQKGAAVLFKLKE